jgi:hypothetical protein
MKRSRPKQRSSERAKEERQYLKLLKPWLAEHPFCEACGTLRFGCRVNPTSENHHKAGREHKLLLDERYWLATCRDCHVWIEEHGKLARRLGFVIDAPVNLDLPGMAPTPRVFH